MTVDVDLPRLFPFALIPTLPFPIISVALYRHPKLSSLTDNPAPHQSLPAEIAEATWNTGSQEISANNLKV
jgi:hypothetical protein